MAEIVNLRRARKARERAGRARKGDENAALSGLTPAERAGMALQAGRMARALVAHRREGATGPQDGDDGPGAD